MKKIGLILGIVFILFGFFLGYRENLLTSESNHTEYKSGDRVTLNNGQEATYWNLDDFSEGSKNKNKINDNKVIFFGYAKYVFVGLGLIIIIGCIIMRFTHKDNN